MDGKVGCERIGLIFGLKMSLAAQDFTAQEHDNGGSDDEVFRKRDD